MKMPTMVGAALALAMATSLMAGAAPSSADSPVPGSTLAGTPRPEVAIDDHGTMARVKLPGVGVQELDHHAVTDTDEQVRRAPLSSADYEVIQKAGDPSSRLNLVFMGDGYTASEQGQFVREARRKWDNLLSHEPFSSYKAAFNVYAVKVISRDSGVDNDPKGVQRDTALDFTLWCMDVERLPCVDLDKVKSYARNAPKADQIIVLGNSDAWAGGGYPGIGVCAITGGNNRVTDVAAHEMGHSMGGLLDEYDYGNQTYRGPEPDAPNITKDPDGRKWSHLWGKRTPDGGTIGAYEGGNEFYSRGVYRPSRNSMMRSAGQPFNLVGLEAMTAAIRRAAPGVNPGDPVDPTRPSPTPSTQPTVRPTPSTQPTTQPTSSPSIDPTSAPSTSVRPTAQPGQDTFSNTTPQSIRDYGTATSRITSTMSGASKVTVTLDIDHPCLQNLDIFITTPDGRRNQVARSSSWAWRCEAFNGARSETYTMRSETRGEWIVEVVDRVRGHEGTLNAWSIKFS